MIPMSFALIEGLKTWTHPLTNSRYLFQKTFNCVRGKTTNRTTLDFHPAERLVELPSLIQTIIIKHYSFHYCLSSTLHTTVIRIKYLNKSLWRNLHSNRIPSWIVLTKYVGTLWQYFRYLDGSTDKYKSTTIQILCIPSPPISKRKMRCVGQ